MYDQRVDARQVLECGVRIEGGAVSQVQCQLADALQVHKRGFREKVARYSHNYASLQVAGCGIC